MPAAEPKGGAGDGRPWDPASWELGREAARASVGCHQDAPAGPATALAPKRPQRVRHWEADAGAHPGPRPTQRPSGETRKAERRRVSRRTAEASREGDVSQDGKSPGDEESARSPLSRLSCLHVLRAGRTGEALCPAQHGPRGLFRHPVPGAKEGGWLVMLCRAPELAGSLSLHCPIPTPGSRRRHGPAQTG